jgi:hypothetical protein
MINSRRQVDEVMLADDVVLGVDGHQTLSFDHV